MIKESFQILKRISKGKEKSIKSQGIKDWNDFIKKDKIKGISNKSKQYYNQELLKASEAIKNNNSKYFKNILPSMETWRLYNQFKSQAVFLDIEVTGVKEYDDIIMVGLFDGIDTKLMIRGINLNMKALEEELKQYKLIITFNGNVFDLPFLKKRYPNLIPDIPTIDLRHFANRHNLKGGLKHIEENLNIKRSDLQYKFRSGDIKRLWRMYLASGDRHYLKLLVEYNEDDCINQKIILERIIKEISA